MPQMSQTSLSVNILKFITAGLLGVFLIVSFLQPVETEDIWWHLAAGRFMSEHHDVPRTDPFSFRNATIPWTLTQWLGSLSYYLVYRQAGLDGLRFFRVFLFMAIMLIFARFARGKIPAYALFFLIFLMAFGLERRSHLRPYVFNFIFIQLELILLTLYRQRERWRYLLPIPVLSAVWFNLHLGGAVYGLGILAAFGLTSLCEYIFTLIRPQAARGPGMAHPGRQCFELGLTAAVFIAAWLINPYGKQGALYPLRVFSDPQFIFFYDFRRIINEMKPPQYLWTWEGIWCLGLTGWVLWTYLRRQQKGLLPFFLLLPALVGFVHSRRLAAVYALLAGYIIVLNWSATGIRHTGRKQHGFAVAAYLVLIGLLALTLTRRLSTGIYKNGRARPTYAQQTNYLTPQRQLAILDRIKAEGIVYNSDILGGYILFNRYPRLRPFIDGRQLDIPAYITAGRAIQYPQVYWHYLEDDFNIRIVLVTVKNNLILNFLKHILASGRWQLIDLDGANTLLVKRDAFDLPPEFAQFETKLGQTRIDENVLRAVLDNPPEPTTLPAGVKDFVLPGPKWVDLWSEGRILYELGYRPAGIDRLARSLQIKNTEERRQALRQMLTEQ